MNKTIKINRAGPYLVKGKVPLKRRGIVGNAHGDSYNWQDIEAGAEEITKESQARDSYCLCRCGQSGNKPFCDGTHATVGFVGEEVASKADYLDLVEDVVENENGQEIELLDASSLCSAARFCHPNGGTWRMVQEATNPEERAAAIKQTCACPSGRLVARDKKTGELIEEKLEQEIIISEDLVPGKHGPLYVTGGIELEGADGEKYPRRNRMTLCRCGRSKNKPFCDGSHLDVSNDD